MAKKPSDTSTISSTEEEDVFSVGDAIVVSAKGSTYHGERGKIYKKCANGSVDKIYVALERSGKKMLNTTSLTRVTGTKSTKRTNKDKFSHDRSDVSILTVETHSKSISGESYAKRVLTLYEFVSDMRDKTEDVEIKFKLKEVEKMIIGLSLNE